MLAGVCVMLVGCVWRLHARDQYVHKLSALVHMHRVHSGGKCMRGVEIFDHGLVLPRPRTAVGLQSRGWGQPDVHPWSM